MSDILTRTPKKYIDNNKWIQPVTVQLVGKSLFSDEKELGTLGYVGWLHTIENFMRPSSVQVASRCFPSPLNVYYYWSGFLYYEICVYNCAHDTGKIQALITVISPIFKERALYLQLKTCIVAIVNLVHRLVINNDDLFMHES